MNEQQGVRPTERMTYRDSTYSIVSKVAYLIGVPKRIFENQHEPPQLEIFQQLENDKNARIIRHLCIIRTAIERNFKYINDKMRTEYKTILSLPQFVPADSISQLSADNVSFIRKWNTKLPAHIIEINRIISDRINNCKHLFPLWLNWKYIRELFIMPNGLCEKGTQEAAAVYYEHILLYPYQMYIHWSPSDQGNILFNDKRFVSLLYRWHNDEFTEYNKVSDAGSYIKDSIYDFIDDSQKVVIVVDCENSDPYKLSATLRRLNSTYTEKITSIILFDDIHTASAWSSLEKFTSVSVEHILIERIKQNKSLVDIRLTARACQEYYENNVDSFIIVCDGEKLNIPNTLCIQGYQLFEKGDYNSDIVVIQLPLDAKENIQQVGLSCPVSPDYAGGDIEFEVVEEQDNYDLDDLNVDDFYRWRNTERTEAFSSAL